jgi:hypothetical protein
MFISDQGVPNTNFFDNTVHSGKGLSFEGNYARKLQNYRWGTLSVEVPVVVNPDEDLNYGLNQIPKDYSSIFVTPAARVNFLQDFAFSPWVSFGGGFAHYVASKDLVFHGTNPGHRVSNSGALEGGIGLDVKIPRVDFFRFRFVPVTIGLANHRLTLIQDTPASTIISSEAAQFFTSSPLSECA